MQDAAGGGAGAGDVPRVCRDFRLDQYNVQHVLSLRGSRALLCARTCAGKKLQCSYSKTNRWKIQLAFRESECFFELFLAGIDQTYAASFCTKYLQRRFNAQSGVSEKTAAAAHEMGDADGGEVDAQTGRQRAVSAGRAGRAGMRSAASGTAPKP